MSDVTPPVPPRIPLSRIIAPRSVAVIGASEDYAKFGGRILHHVIRHGFAGRLIPVNPRRDTLLGLPAFASIGAAPGPVDLAIVAVPVGQLLQTVGECAAAGVGACIVFTAQLGEFDAAGAALQEQVVAVARGAGMRLIGPNCMGMISATQALGLTSSPTLGQVPALRAGRVGLVSQSGALMGALFIFAHDHGIGLSTMISVGNQADIDLCDMLEALIEDAATGVICLYVEAVSDGARFAALARRARAAGKRILAVKAGRTEAGSAMARSHTASLAGSFAGFEAMCRDTGILLMDEAEGMILAAGVLADCPAMGAGGIGMVVSSGGNGAVTADRMVAEGLPLAEWGEDTRARLSAHFLPSHQNNPVDLGAHTGALGPHIFAEAVAAVADDPGVAALVYLMTPQPLMPQTAEAVIAARARTNKPTVFILDTSRFADEVREQLIAAGMPFVSRIDDALRVLRALVREREMAALAALPAPTRPAGAGPLPASLRDGALTEPEAKALFAAYGIPVTRERVVGDAEAAAAAAVEIGFPVVLKGVSREVVHKSDLGLVRLNLRDAAAVRDAFAAVVAALPEADAAAVVQEMVRGEAEVILGARRDAVFGPQVLVGLGGVLVEVLRDVQLAVAPIGPEAAEAMLRRLALWPLLEGVRGRPALDVGALCDAISRFSWLAADLGERLEDLEANPVILRAAGEGLVAVDGRGRIGA
ncbi:acetate--CoA ligase family protein [Roseomonas sp. BN140053]|uniref:acetate--CoA ligase family protein n=1 Tax=Roseomonas sp. BN140053 TaxID=3391898 RepID=UPI0039E9488E